MISLRRRSMWQANARGVPSRGSGKLKLSGLPSRAIVATASFARVTIGSRDAKPDPVVCAAIARAAGRGVAVPPALRIAIPAIAARTSTTAAAARGL